MPRRMPVPTGPDLCEPVGSSTRVSYFSMRSAFREAVSLLEIRSFRERHQRRASPKPIFCSRRPSVTCELDAIHVTGIIVRQRMRRWVIGRVLKPGTVDISQGRFRCRGCVLGPWFFPLLSCGNLLAFVDAIDVSGRQCADLAENFVRKHVKNYDIFVRGHEHGATGIIAMIVAAANR